MATLGGSGGLLGQPRSPLGGQGGVFGVPKGRLRVAEGRPWGASRDGSGVLFRRPRGPFERPRQALRAAKWAPYGCLTGRPGAPLGAQGASTQLNSTQLIYFNITEMQTEMIANQWDWCKSNTLKSRHLSQKKLKQTYPAGLN